MTEIATQEVARSRAAMIRAGIQNYLHTLAHIAAAYQQRDWKALGYDSWDAYVDGEYSEHRLKLSTEHRQKAVAELRLAGMSTRAIGSALGVSKDTVARDLGTVAPETVPDRITGMDGREQPSTRPSSPTGPTDAHEASPGADRSGHQPPAATGEADAQLDAAVPAVVSEAPTGAPAPVGAGDDSTGNDLGPVDAQESAWTPSAAPGPDGQTSGPGVPDAEPVRVRLYVDTGFSGAEHDDVIEIERAEWNGMTPAERRAYLADEARTLMENHIEWGWLISDDADMADTEDAE